ncbi:MAG: diguanylate cyclase [Sphingomonadaceae bacterium]|nr:diguanylate cyclase [Sphingomonadaceae bacterium]
MFRQSGWRAQAILACFVLLGLMMTGASLSAYRSADQRTAVEALQARTQGILSASANLKVAVLNSARGERGYVLTGNPAFLEPYADAKPEIRSGLARLHKFAGSHAADGDHVHNIEARLQDLANWQEGIIGLKRNGHHQQAVNRIKSGDGKRMIESVLDELAHVELHAKVTLAASTREASRLSRANELYQYGLTLVGLILLIISAIATVAVRRSIDAETQARDELQRRAMTDDLTGLANRRELLSSLERAIAAARRNRRPLALALIDIDHFKRINDNHGHPAGDAVIRRIAMLAVDVMRGQDTVGRLGGEEFAVVLPDASAQDALAACERLREAVGTTDLEMETGHQIYITLSTGIAVFDRHDSAETMIARADAALYAAKHGGRDQVKLAA